MSSAGHVLDSINRMKANRFLRTKRLSFNLNELNTFKPLTRRKDYRYNTLNPKLRAKLRDQLKKERKIDLVKQLVILAISVAITLFIFI